MFTSRAVHEDTKRILPISSLCAISPRWRPLGIGIVLLFSNMLSGRHTTSLFHVFVLPTTPDVDRFRFGAFCLCVLGPSCSLFSLELVGLGHNAFLLTPPNNDGRRVWTAGLRLSFVFLLTGASLEVESIDGSLL